MPESVLKRYKLYINGLDEKIENGIPKGHIVLLCGASGSMKSYVALNILYNHAKQNKTTGVYLSLEEGRHLIERRMAKMGMIYEEVAKDLFLIDLGYLRKEVKDAEILGIGWMQAIETQIRHFRENFGNELLVIDSINALYSITTFRNPRDELFHFFENLRSMDLTVFLISEMPPTEVRFSHYGVEDFLSDGIIHLDLRRVDINVNLYIGVVKMRDTKHERKYFPLIVSKDNKFEIVVK